MVKSRSIVARVHCGEETEGRGWTRGKAGGAAIFVAAPSLRLRQFFQIGNTVRSIN